MTQQINFRNTVASLNESTQTERVDVIGKIESITLHFPPGCNALVEATVWHGTCQILPERGGISMNDATPSFPMNVPVQVGDQITFKIQNHDDTNPHTLSAVVSIIEAPIKLLL